MKYYTSVEQSKKLLELGLKPESADMGYLWNGTSYCKYPVCNEIIFIRIENIPCWSVGALLEVMPIEFILSREHIKGEIKHRVSYVFEEPCEGGYFEGNSYLDACYKTIVWLLENNYIKKGE